MENSLNWWTENRIMVYFDAASVYVYIYLILLVLIYVCFASSNKGKEYLSVYAISTIRFQFF